MVPPSPGPGSVRLRSPFLDVAFCRLWTNPVLALGDENSQTVLMILEPGPQRTIKQETPKWGIVSSQSFLNLERLFIMYMYLAAAK